VGAGECCSRLTDFNINRSQLNDRQTPPPSAAAANLDYRRLGSGNKRISGCADVASG